MSSDVPPPVLPRRPRIHSAQPGPDRASVTSSTPSAHSPPIPSPLPMNNQSSAPKLEDNNAFGYSLQSGYEAIGKRHDEELHALESMRMHIFKRMKCDRDYADQLFRANQSCERLGQFSSSTTSAAVQAWKVFLQLSVKLQSQVSSAADQMKSMLEVVDDLIKNKRGAKKVCDDERVRLDAEFSQSCKEVQDLRRDYRKHLRNTEKCKNQLQGLIQKQAKPNEIDRSRNKFVASAKKLHQCHNDYTLSVVNVNIHQDFYRHTLLPFCLNTLQQRMELQITEWKTVMSHYASALDFTKAYEESFGTFGEALSQVEKEQEYVQFIRDNAKERPPVELFEFDGSLLYAPCAPTNVTAGQVVVNNLTHKTLTERQQKLENEINQLEADISEKNEHIGTLQNQEENIASPRSQKSVPNHVQIADLKAKVFDLTEKKTKKENQLALINQGLSIVGEATPPLFDPLGEGADEKEVDALDVSMSQPSQGGKKKGGGGGKMFTIKRIFAKSSKHKATAMEEDPSNEQEELSSSAVGGFDHPDSGGYEDEEEAADIPIDEEEWYFGNIERREAEFKCKDDGDFLVRYSDKKNTYVLTVHWNGMGRHFVIQEVQDPSHPGSIVYRFEDKAFPIVRELLSYHIQSQIPVTRTSGAVLAKAISKIDKWAIRREDLKLGRKLGRGAFGEVCEATMLTTGEKVAVKTCRETIPQSEKRKFLMEADILKQYDHPNVVKLIGVCAEKDPVFIIMEMLPGGALLDFLRKKGSNQTKKKLTMMVTDACAGMAYLESMKCIHRDLAARNCLVGDADVVKISDFGMSREEECGIYTVSSGAKQIPIKWTAPEALNLGRYTSACDVWSFGILLWETFSLGATPYPGMANNEAREQVEAGYRLPPPNDCPDIIYGIMQLCWQYDDEDRPQFSELLQRLQEALPTING